MKDWTWEERYAVSSVEFGLRFLHGYYEPRDEDGAAKHFNACRRFQLDGLWVAGDRSEYEWERKADIFLPRIRRETA